MFANEPGLETTNGVELNPEGDKSQQPQPESIAESAPISQSSAQEVAPLTEQTTAEAVGETASAPVAAAPAQDSAAHDLDEALAHSGAAASSAHESPASAPPGERPTGKADVAFVEAVSQEANLPKPFSRGELVEGVIIATSPTQIVVDVGGKGEGIITSSELEKMSRQMLQSLKIGDPITVYVVNPHDPKTGHMILSVLRAMEELDWRTAEAYRQSQQTYETQIAGYNKGGLIVRFGRLRGFVPQSQMSADRRRALSENEQDAWSGMVNQSILVKVMEVDRSRNRLILSERMASRENREKRKAELIERLTVGEVRKGRVVSLEDFGAFVDIGGAEGLIHLTEMSYQHVNHPRDVLKVGQEVDVEVISVDPVAKRIGLSMKRMMQDPWDRVATESFVGQLVQG
ncbi:MAG: S1 RNA-binding domain-containing protein, partial [Anaerolinea sp.]|nr:S1 RNA-binding domain-containing protein [Anaerolinea sp.]